MISKPKDFVSACTLLLAVITFSEGKLGAPQSSTRDAEGPYTESESSSSAAHRRHLLCKDHEGVVKYTTKSSNVIIMTTCTNLANQVAKGVYIANKCHRGLVNMDGFGSEAKVSDACPNACGTSCETTTTSTSEVITIEIPESSETPALEPIATPTPKPTRTPTQKNVGLSLEGRGEGEWGGAFDMELIPIHAMVLPDGCLLSYGTNAKGRQRADLFYEVWDLGRGTRQEAHKLLQHSTRADIFCSTLNVDPSTGNIIIMGGDVRDPNAGLGIEVVLEFNYKTHEIRKHPLGNMEYARWYGTSVNLPNGDIFVVGGRSEDKRKLGSPVPEVWSPNIGFRALKGAKIPAIAKELDKNHWWYPHTFVNSNGEIIVIMPRKNNADIYRVGVDGDGSIERIGRKPFEAHVRSPSIMFRVDKIMFLDDKGGLWVVDISGKIPKWTKKNDIGDGRTNGSLSLLPDGRVAITGGAKSTSDGGSNLGQAIYSIQIWDPTTNKIRRGPRQKYSRLYHSSALILPDGVVLSAGGGAPGPQKNRNGHLYYPDYLFDKKQDAVVRPIILACPQNVETGKEFVIKVDDTSRVHKVTATKSGADTHTRNCDARWLDLEFEILNGQELVIFTEDRNIMITGLWMLNTINSFGVPSVASLIGVNMAPLDI